MTGGSRAPAVTDKPLTDKACPIVLRGDRRGRIEMLAFEHPEAGRQFVKGSIEPGESPARAAVRELFEESGVACAAEAVDLGSFEMPAFGQRWHASLCTVRGLPDHWVHRTADGGGLDFRFFWHDLGDALDEHWHPLFRLAASKLIRLLKAADLA